MWPTGAHKLAEAEGSLVNNVLSVIPELGAKCGGRDDKDQFCLREPEQVSVKKTEGGPG